MGLDLIAATQTEYARLLVEHDEASEASLLHQQAIDLYKKQHNDRPTMQVADCLLEKGLALLSIEVFDEAQTAIQLARDQYRQLLDDTAFGKHPKVGMCFNCLGQVHRYFEEFDEAAEAFKQCVAIYEAAKMGTSQEAANAYNNFGTLYDEMVRLLLTLIAVH